MWREMDGYVMKGKSWLESQSERHQYHVGGGTEVLGSEEAKEEEEAEITSSSGLYLLDPPSSTGDHMLSEFN